MASSKLTTSKDKWLLTKSNTVDKERALSKNLQEEICRVAPNCRTLTLACRDCIEVVF